MNGLYFDIMIMTMYVVLSCIQGQLYSVPNTRCHLIVSLGTYKLPNIFQFVEVLQTDKIIHSLLISGMEGFSAHDAAITYHFIYLDCISIACDLY